MNPRPVRKDNAAVYHHNAGHLTAMTRGYLTAATCPSGTPMHTVPPHATLRPEDVPAETWDAALAVCARVAQDHPADVAWLPARIIGYHLRMSQHAAPDDQAAGFLALQRPLSQYDAALWQEFNLAMQRLHTHARTLSAHAAPAPCR